MVYGSESLTLWQKIYSPLTILIMSLLAIPFVLGSQRQSNTGYRIMVGMTIGLGFVVLQNILVRIGEQLFQDAYRAFKNAGKHFRPAIEISGVKPAAVRVIPEAHRTARERRGERCRCRFCCSRRWCWSALPLPAVRWRKSRSRRNYCWRPHIGGGNCFCC